MNVICGKLEGIKRRKLSTQKQYFKWVGKIESHQHIHTSLLKKKKKHTHTHTIIRI